MGALNFINSVKLKIYRTISTFKLSFSIFEFSFGILYKLIFLLKRSKQFPANGLGVGNTGLLELTRSPTLPRKFLQELQKNKDTIMVKGPKKLLKHIVMNTFIVRL